MKWFLEFTTQQIADAMEVSVATVESDWMNGQSLSLQPASLISSNQAERC